MGEEPEIAELAALAVGRAEAAGAAAAEAWCEEGTEQTIRVFRQEVENLTEADGRGLGLKVRLDGRTGYAYTSDLSEGALDRLAKVAVEVAGAVDPDESEELPASFGSAEIDGDISEPDFPKWDIERKVELAVEADRAASSRDKRISQVKETVYGDRFERVALANSAGFSSQYERTQCFAYTSALAGEGAERMTGTAVVLARGPKGIDPEALGAEAADRAIALLGAGQPESRHCPVVLDPEVAASFVAIAGSALCADAVQRGRSPFAGQEGQRIASQALELMDDGLDPDGPASAPFDGEGSPQRRTPLISGGELKGFLYDSVSARRVGARTTGNARRVSYRTPPAVGTTNLVLKPGGVDLEELFRQADKGLYVMQVFGLHSGVNPVTGALSVGVAGRLIEAGELGSPVREITIAGDLVSLLKDVVVVGSELRWCPTGIKAPAMLIGEMSVSGS